MNLKISDLVQEVDERHPPTGVIVFSVSETFGILPQTQLFKKKIATDDISKYRRVQYGDVIFNPYLLWNRAVGVCFDFRGGCVSPAYPVLRPRKKGIERFLHYFFRSHQLVSSVNSIATGSVTRRRTAPLSDILNLSFDLPDLAHQITANYLLTLLDGKIDLNRTMNDTMETMAREIFKSWFVDFTPVRAKAEGRCTGLSQEIAELFPNSFEDSELGDIPKGWKVCALPSVIEVNPLRSLRKGVIAPYLDMANVSTNTALAKQIVEREFKAGTKFKNGDTLLARITPCLENGKTAYVDFLADGQVGWGSTEFIVLRSKQPLPSLFAYFLARDDRFRTFAISNMIGTSGRQRVPADCLNNYLLIVPSPKVASAFATFTSFVLQKMKSNDQQSRTLATLRDTLLPKLISGQIRVGDAIDQVKEVM